jgi:hypothetical protein
MDDEKPFQALVAPQPAARNKPGLQTELNDGGDTHKVAIELNLRDVAEPPL